MGDSPIGDDASAGPDAQADRKRILYVGNLKFETTEDGLRDAFSPFGNCSVRIPVNDRGRRKGFGFVQFDTNEEAEKAIEAMHGKELDGRELRVCVSESQGGAGRGDNRGYGGGNRDGSGQGYGRRDRYDDRDGGYGSRDRYDDRGGGYGSRDRRDGGRGRY